MIYFLQIFIPDFEMTRVQIYFTMFLVTDEYVLIGMPRIKEKNLTRSA